MSTPLWKALTGDEEKQVYGRHGWSWHLDDQMQVVLLSPDGRRGRGRSIKQAFDALRPVK